MLQAQKLKHKEVRKLTKIIQTLDDRVESQAQVIFSPKSTICTGLSFHLFLLLLSAFDHVFLGQSILFNKSV